MTVPLLPAVFQVARCSAGDGTLRLDGRALCGLKRGDTLYALPQGAAGRSLGFLIEAITAYRRDWEEISGGMTCRLAVRGAGPELKAGSLLYGVCGDGPPGRRNHL